MLSWLPFLVLCIYHFCVYNLCGSDTSVSFCQTDNVKSTWTGVRKPLKGFTALYRLPDSNPSKLHHWGSFTSKYIIRDSADQICFRYRHLVGLFIISYFLDVTDFSVSLLRVFKRVLIFCFQKTRFLLLHCEWFFCIGHYFSIYFNILTWLL